MEPVSRGYSTRAAVGAAGLVLLALATAYTVSAATPDSASATHYGARTHRLHSPFLRALQELNLTPDQWTAVRSILTTSRQQGAASAPANRPDFVALQNPGDPNHALAVQAAQARASAWVQQRSLVRASIYNLLTPEQKATLPTILARLQTQKQPWRSRHDKGAAPPSSG